MACKSCGHVIILTENQDRLVGWWFLRTDLLNTHHVGWLHRTTGENHGLSLSSLHHATGCVCVCVQGSPTIPCLLHIVANSIQIPPPPAHSAVVCLILRLGSILDFYAETGTGLEQAGAEISKRDTLFYCKSSCITKKKLALFCMYFFQFIFI